MFTSCLIGLLTASIYAMRIKHLRDEINRSSEKVPVLAVNRKIRAGEIIGSGDLTQILVLKEKVSGRSISPENMDLIAGRQVIHPLPANDPILWTDFPEGPRVRYPSEKIPPGYRVIALPADELHTLSHFIKPGDKVDIVSITYEDSKNSIESRSIGQNIEILAVGNPLGEGAGVSALEEFPSSVSLLVLPEMALTILKAVQTGEVHFLALGSGKYPGASIPTTPSDFQEIQTGERP